MSGVGNLGFLPGAYVVFDCVGKLRVNELNRKAILKVTNDARLHAAERDMLSDRGPGFRRKGRTRQRQVDDPARHGSAVVEFEEGHRTARYDTIVPAVFWQIEDLAISKPGELRRKLVALTRCGGDSHGKAVVEQPGDLAFNAADVVEIGDNAFADIADTRGQHGEPAGRHIDDLTWKFAPIGQHVAAEQMNLDALKAPALLSGRTNYLSLHQRHHHTGQPVVRFRLTLGWSGLMVR